MTYGVDRDGTEQKEAREELMVLPLLLCIVTNYRISASCTKKNAIILQFSSESAILK